MKKKKKNKKKTKKIRNKSKKSRLKKKIRKSLLKRKKIKKRKIKKRKIKIKLKTKIKIPKIKLKPPKFNFFKKIKFQSVIEWLAYPIFSAYENFREKRRSEKLKRIALEKAERERQIKEERRLRYEGK